RVPRHHRSPGRRAVLPLRLVDRGAPGVSDFHPSGFPKTTRLTPLVGRVLGLNPGLMTGPGTNTYVVGARRPLLLDTGAGVPEYLPLLRAFLRAEGEAAVSRVILTPRHLDHIGAGPHVRPALPRRPGRRLGRTAAPHPAR